MSRPWTRFMTYSRRTGPGKERRDRVEGSGRRLATEERIEQPKHLAGGDETNQPDSIQHGKARDDRRREGAGSAEEGHYGDQNELIDAVGGDQRERQHQRCAVG